MCVGLCRNCQQAVKHPTVLVHYFFFLNAVSEIVMICKFFWTSAESILDRVLQITGQGPKAWSQICLTEQILTLA